MFLSALIIGLDGGVDRVDGTRRRVSEVLFSTRRVDTPATSQENRPYADEGFKGPRVEVIH